MIVTKHYIPIKSDPLRAEAMEPLGKELGSSTLRYIPLCVECMKEGRYVKATDVDHIVPHRGDQKLFWDRNNWQALCKRCHDRKIMADDRYLEYKY